MRIVISVLLVFVAILLSFTRVSASCNEFESVQSVVLSERTRGSLAEDIEIARVAVTKGACYRDANYYTGYGIAEHVLRDNSVGCISNTHCRAYFLLYTIDPSIRELAALASHIALSEMPPVRRFHFDRYDSTAAWWDALSACPNGWFIVGMTKVC